MRTDQAVEQFLDDLQQQGRSPHTMAAYRRDLAVFCRFIGTADIKSVTPELLLRFMATDGVQVGPSGTQRAKPTVNRYRVSLKALFGWCEARWLIPRNPTSILKCRRHRGLPPVVLTEAEVEQILSYQFSGRHADRDSALLAFMLLTGCRLGETTTLDVGDIDLTAGTVTLRCPKGGEPDRIIICTRLIAIIRSQIQRTPPHEPIWSTTAGARLSERQIQRLVASRVREAGINNRVTPHAIRHTFATILYNRTGDIRLVQQALRHHHVTTTETYAHLDPIRLKTALNSTAKSA